MSFLIGQVVRNTDVTVYIMRDVPTTSGTTSTTYVALASPMSMTFVVPSTGAIEVSITGDLWSSAAQFSRVGYAISGTDTVAAADAEAAQVFGTNGYRSQIVSICSGLTPNATDTITLLQRGDSSSNTANCLEITCIVRAA